LIDMITPPPARLIVPVAALFEVSVKVNWSVF
jgi:hypothetical protein